jgi:sec-independent protein translocase protein TatA
MGWTGIWQWVVVLVIVLILFGGRGKISALMGDVGKGLRSFKKGLKEGEESDGGSEEASKALESETATTADDAAERDKAAKS